MIMMTMDPMIQFYQNLAIADLPDEEQKSFLEIGKSLKEAIETGDTAKAAGIVTVLSEKVEKYSLYSLQLKAAAVLLFRDTEHKEMALAAFQKARKHSSDPRERMDYIMNAFQSIEL
jgi:hypothetical protein